MNPPSYLPRRNDVDVISVHSNAPSYTSTLPPNYDLGIENPPPARRPPPPPQQQQYSSLLGSSPLHENYHVASWPSLTGSGHQNRAYANVAARRARRDEDTREMDAAARAAIKRNQQNRLEIKEEVSVQHREHALADEAKSWDHLLAQMADWNERERSWNEFRARYESTGKKRAGKKIFGRRS